MSALLNWVAAHQGAVAGAIVAVIDLAMALVPSWASNGILHFFLVQAQKLQGK